MSQYTRSIVADTHSRFMKAVFHKDVHPVPVAGWDNAVPITRMYGVKALDYYEDIALKLNIQKKIINEFPSIKWIPGLHADFGVIVEASAFGCKVKWFDDETPFAYPIINSLNDVKNLKVPNPNVDGMMPKVIDDYRYMWKNLETWYIEECGYLEGFALTLGPLELAATLCGQENFYLGVYDDPKRLHKLLEITTETCIRWVQAQEKVNGALKFLVVVDHIPANLSVPLLEEFAVPYFKQVFSKFAYAPARLYHNEGDSNHYITLIPEFGANIFHCGAVDLLKAKRKIGNEVCLMGNLNPIKLLQAKSAESIKEKCLALLRVAAPGSGYVLSTGGAMAPYTSKNYLWAMIQASTDYDIELNKSYQTSY